MTELEVERLHAKTKLNSVSVWVLKRTNKLKLLVKVKIELTNSIQGETLTLKEHFYIACVRLKKSFYRLMNYSQLFRATTIKILFNNSSLLSALLLSFFNFSSFQNEKTRFGFFTLLYVRIITEKCAFHVVSDQRADLLYLITNSARTANYTDFPLAFSLFMKVIFLRWRWEIDRQTIGYSELKRS